MSDDPIDVPAADLWEQREALVPDEEPEAEPDEMPDAFEADPADVAEQRSELPPDDEPVT